MPRGDAEAGRPDPVPGDIDDDDAEDGDKDDGHETATTRANNNKTNTKQQQTPQQQNNNSRQAGSTSAHPYSGWKSVGELRQFGDRQAAEGRMKLVLSCHADITPLRCEELTRRK